MILGIFKIAPRLKDRHISWKYTMENTTFPYKSALSKAKFEDKQNNEYKIDLSQKTRFYH